jgi:phage portal protein BeeE
MGRSHRLERVKIVIEIFNREQLHMDLKAFAKKIWNFGEPKHSHLLENVGWHTVSGSSLDYFARNDYENAYPSIRVIAQKFASIEPYTIDKTGESVESNVLDRLYTPNNQMSAYDFREALAVMSLVHNKVYIRVHHRGVRINADSITGFTFLEGVREHIIDGRMEYWLPNGEKIGTDEVVVLKSVNPYNLNDGFSPAFAARRWTSLDDLIADYQTGFFRNGAVPSGQFIITARTAKDFQDMANTLQEKHRGAGNNNNVVYVHRPTDALGKPTESQVEWVPFSTENKDLALKDIFAQAERKIDSVYGVPAEIRGFLSNSNYASVATAERVFVAYTLQPFALKVWQKFTHELNRITGGAGVAITFDLDMPVVADEEKVKAEAQSVVAGTIVALQQSFELDSIATYLKSGDPVDLIEKPEVLEKPEILSSDEADETPDQPVDNTKPSAKSKAMSDGDREKYEDRLAKVVTDRLSAQIDKVESLVTSKAVSPDEPLEAEEDALLAAAMLAVLLASITDQGQLEHVANVSLVLQAGINTDSVSPFEMTGAQKAQYSAYVEKVARGYNVQTAERIQNILTVGREQKLSASEIRKQLRGLIDETWRIERIARTEINKAGNEASLYSMENIAKETGATIEKVWEHSGSEEPCEFCRAYIGRSVPLREAFVPMNETIQGEDGGIRVNDFEPIEVGGMHANCHCRQTYRVVGEAA